MTRKSTENRTMATATNFRQLMSTSSEDSTSSKIKLSPLAKLKPGTSEIRSSAKNPEANLAEHGAPQVVSKSPTCLSPTENSPPSSCLLEEIQSLQKYLDFRKEMDLDRLTRCFEEDPRAESSDPMITKYRRRLHHGLSSKHLYVQGYDRDGRSTFIFVPRFVREHDDTWTIREHVWTLERALACTKAKDKTVNAMVDFAGFSAARHAPPMAMGQEFLTTLKSHYAGHVHQIFLVNAPLSFLCLWTILKPFVGPRTRRKINFVKSGAEKRQVIGKYYDQDQVASWMHPSGTKNKEFDVEDYLYRTPFHKAFDEDLN